MTDKVLGIAAGEYTKIPLKTDETFLLEWALQLLMQFQKFCCRKLSSPGYFVEVVVDVWWEDSDRRNYSWYH